MGKMNEQRARIRELRRRLYLNQGKFAEKMGVKQNTWSTLESGDSPLPDRYVKLVCLTFNVNEEWLKNGTGDMFESPAISSTPVPALTGRPAPTPEVNELITICKELLPLNMEAVLSFAGNLLQSQRNTIETLNNKKDTVNNV